MAASLQVMYVRLHGHNRARLRGEQAYLLPGTGSGHADLDSDASHGRSAFPFGTAPEAGTGLAEASAAAPAAASAVPEALAVPEVSPVPEAPVKVATASPAVGARPATRDTRRARVLFSAIVGQTYESAVVDSDQAQGDADQDEENGAP